MKDDFEGVQFDYQYSFYQHDNSNSTIQNIVTDAGFPTASGGVTDGDTHDFSLILGANTPNGLGNVTMYATVRDVASITQDSRDYSSCALDLDDDNSLVCAGSSTIPDTRVTDFAGGFDFQVDGTDFVPFNSLYNYGPLNHFQRPDKRTTLGAFGHYELNEKAELYAEVNFMDDTSNAQIAPSGAFFITDEIPCGNPLLSAQQFDQLCGQFGLTTGDVQNAYVGRRNVEGGPRNDDLRHTSYRAVVGVRGDIDDNWSYDVFANYGNVILSELYNNELSITRIQRALNATLDTDGNIVCQSVVDGSDPLCVPYNVFQTGGVTQAQTDYLVLPLFSRGETESKQISGFITGDLTDAGVVMPGTNEGASIVLGMEYREDKLVYEPDTGYTSGDGAGQGGPVPSVSGSLDVSEFFGEFSLPLVEDASFADYLRLDLGYRYSDYSTNKSTNTYKVALDWGINENVKVRTSFQIAIRHANVRELFVPQAIGLYNADEDPCAGAEPTFTQAECLNLGVSGDRYGTVADSPAGQYNGLLGGNANLEPEESETISAGIVFTPMDGLDIALDYFSIDVEGAISTISPEVIYDECAAGDATFCAMINRAANQTLWVAPSFVDQTNVNIGFIETSGIDFDVSYEHQVGDMGKLDFSLLGTLLTKWETEPVVGKGVVDCLGFWDRTTCGAQNGNPTPEWRWNLSTAWTTPWNATISGTLRYMGEAEELNDGPTDLDSQTYLDVAISWDVLENTTVRFGMSNLLDEEPPIVPNAPSGSGNGNTFPGSYDYLGRYIFAGVTYTL